MNKKIEKIIILLSLAVIILLVVFFFMDMLVPLLRAEFSNDIAGAKELLRSRGVFGALTITVVEALQMVVVFISAEFIQIAAGLSYPFPVAVLLCDAGVCLGATIIFILVRTFRLSNSAYEKRKKRIDRISGGEKDDRKTVLLLYFLFFMPLIPFGAICYYGSGTRLKYPKYILTVATGAIPSGITSILMGTAAKHFIRNSIPVWLLVLIIIVLAAALFALIYLFLDRLYLRENDKTPDSVVHSAILGLAHFLRKRRQKLVIDRGDLDSAEAPYIILSNHPSFWDFYYVDRIGFDRRPAIVANDYYMHLPGLKKIAKKVGVVPKKLFCPDFTSVAGMMRMLRSGYSLLIFPEGRLSVDGTTYPFTESSAAFFKKLGRDLVLINISGAYFSKPKWRKKFFRSEIGVTVKRVIKADEAASMSNEELDGAIFDGISSDDSKALHSEYRRRDMAKGIEDVLYRCAFCGSLYSTEGVGNTLVCRECGKRLEFGRDYLFDGEPRSIHGYYEKIKELEREELDTFSLEAKVTTKIFRKSGKREKEKGVCRLSPDGFDYESVGGMREHIPLSDLPALAFSCREEFELYIGGELYYFYPDENPRQTVRWALLVDLLNENRGSAG